MPKPEFLLKSKQFTNVWHFQRVPHHRLLHPTEKPEQLISRIIESATLPGDVVLDPFMGPGTTAVACKRMNRRFLGFEIEPTHVNTAEARLRKVNFHRPFPT